MPCPLLRGDRLLTSPTSSAVSSLPRAASTPDATQGWFGVRRRARRRGRGDGRPAPRVLRVRSDDVAAAPAVPLRRRGHVRRAAAPRSRGGDRPVHGRAPSAVLQARAVRSLARGAARVLGARCPPPSAVHRRRLHRARSGRRGCAGTTTTRRSGADRCRRTAGGSSVGPCGDTASVARWRRGLISLVAGSAMAILMTSPVSASLAHAKVVSATPAAFTPKVVLGTSGETVFAFAQVGTTMYVGGKFAQLRDSTGQTTYDRANFAAFNAKTGAMLPLTLPTNGAVQVIVPAPDGKSIYIGGDYTSISGVTARGIVRFDLTTDTIDPAFQPGARRRRQRRRVRRVAADHRRHVHPPAAVDRPAHRRRHRLHQPARSPARPTRTTPSGSAGSPPIRPAPRSWPWATSRRSTARPAHRPSGSTSPRRRRRP